MVICQPIGVVLCGKLCSTAVNSGYDRGHSWLFVVNYAPAPPYVSYQAKSNVLNDPNSRVGLEYEEF